MKACLALLGIGLTACSFGQARLPLDADEIAGLFMIRRGFENLTIELKPGGKKLTTQVFDHPGKNKWYGTWRWESGTVVVTTYYRQDGKPKSVRDVWVPLVWGDRVMLVDDSDLKDGVIGDMFRRDAQRLSSWTSPGKIAAFESISHVAIRVKRRSDKYPRRYGELVVPPAYAHLLPGIKIRRMPPPDLRSSRPFLRRSG